MRKAPREGLIILVVEDDAATATAMARALQSSGYEVVTVENGEEARAALEHVKPALIILDLMLPGADGLVLTSAFKALSDAPIIICSARDQQVDRVLGLKLGADDFVAKPFDIDELEARIQSVLRRHQPQQRPSTASEEEITVGELTIAPARGWVAVSGQTVRLTPTEYRLLVALASRPGEVVSRADLSRQLWNYVDSDTDHIIDVHLGRLRPKLRSASPTAPAIVTIRGRGYALEPRTN